MFRDNLIPAAVLAFFAFTAWSLATFEPTQAIVIEDPDLIVLRGDANHDGKVDISDASYIDNFLFSGGPEPQCMDEADVDDSGEVTIADRNWILDWLFEGGPPPSAPYPHCGTDETEDAWQCGPGSCP